MRVTTGTRLKQLMNERDLKQIDILRLSEPFQKELNISLSKSALSQYVNDVQSPDQYKLTLLGKTLNVSEAWLMGYDVPKEVNVAFGEIDEIDILSIYNKLKESRQKKVYNYAEKQLHEQESTAKENKTIDITDYISVPVRAKISAGTGITWLDDSTYEKVVSSAPSNYDEAFEVSGDSMLPLFQDGEIVFVKHVDDVENCQIAVVQIDDDSYIKKVYKEKDGLRLVSLNKDYEDIIADGSKSIKIVGRVIL